MAITKTIVIDGRPVAFKASASVPRLYRTLFGKDIFEDMERLMSSMEQSSADDSTLSIHDLELFENIAFTMARHADPGIPATPDEWLEGFSMFSIYQILPELIELWRLNNETQSEAKKK